MCRRECGKEGLKGGGRFFLSNTCKCHSQVQNSEINKVV